MHASRSSLLVVAVSLCACAGDLVVRAPRHREPPGETALSAIAPVSVEIPAARGGGSSREPVGEREAGLGASTARIYLTEDPGAIVWRLVADELRAAGHRVVETGGTATLAIEVLEFSVKSERSGRGWDVSADVRFSIRVEKRPGSEDWRESVYTSERMERSYVPPGVGITERVLAGCLDELADLVSRRDALASALERYAGGAPGPPDPGRPATP